MSALSANSIWFMLSMVLVAGFVGSAHCVGMCGPIILSVGRSSKNLVTYHLARLTSYCLAGGVVGFIGQQVTSLASAWLMFVIMAMMGSTLILIGLRRYHLGTFHFRPPSRSSKPFTNLWARLSRLTFRFRDRHPNGAAAVIGFLTILLPCGHLYIFLAAAAATGSAVKGLALMATFAIGTLPALALGPLLLQKILSPIARSKIAGICLVLAGLSSLGHFAWKWHVANGESKANATTPARAMTCH